MVAPASSPSLPLRLALVDDYEVVLHGVAQMLAPFADRIEVVEIDTEEPVSVDVDIALYDTFAQPEADQDAMDTLLANPHAAAVVVYTWAFASRLIETALDKGARGYLSKKLPGSELADALVSIQEGQIVVSENPSRVQANAGHDWPGRSQGLTERESEVVALITQGHSNKEIAALTYLSASTVKMYIRTSYRKMRVASRTQAVLWGLRNGFDAPHHQMDRWR